MNEREKNLARIPSLLEAEHVMYIMGKTSMTTAYSIIHQIRESCGYREEGKKTKIGVNIIDLVNYLNLDMEQTLLKIIQYEEAVGGVQKREAILEQLKSKKRKGSRC